MTESELMIPVVDMSEANQLREELAQHPLYKRRGDVEQAFLDELTTLTRKYGLELKGDTRTDYGETYPDHVLVVPYEGTEGRYVFGSFGVEFAAMKKGALLPCSDAERKQYDAAKKARAEEDKAIDDLSRRISDAHYKAMEIGQTNMMERYMAQMQDKPPAKPQCSCGATFRSERYLKAHSQKTGHRA